MKFEITFKKSSGSVQVDAEQLFETVISLVTVC